MDKRILKMEVRLEDGSKRVIFFPVVIKYGQEKVLNNSLLARGKKTGKEKQYVKRSNLLN